MSEKTGTKTGTSKEYLDRWNKPLVNPPITYGSEAAKLAHKQFLERKKNEGERK